MGRAVVVPQMKDLGLLPMNWKAPDYAGIFQTRMENLERLRERPERFPQLKAYYADGNYADFINDWGVTYDPRNAEIGLPTIVPMVLFPRQREWVEWVIERWRAREPGLCEKSRDVGVSWLAMGLSCTLCIFNEGVTIGVGSRQELLVDKIGFMKALIPKGRMFMEHLPVEFRAGYVPWRDSPKMRISFPDTGSHITGEAGDEIGRGDRTSMFLVDESAHLKRPHLIDASLSATTNCRIDMSSVKGMANSFAAKRWAGKIKLFIFDWREDPRKDQAWYDKQCEELDPVVVAQEIDRDYSASVKGIVIPGAWVRSAIDAKKKLGIAPAGIKRLAFDVADEGEDKNAVCLAEGVEVVMTDEWSGKGSDIFASTEYVFDVCDENGLREFRYDADGVGADVRGDARILNERRAHLRVRKIAAVGYRGSEAVHDPEGIVEGTIGTEGDAGRTNEDYFGNRKAQSWWSLRKRFQRTHRWVVDGVPCPPDDIISLNPENPTLMKLVAELSQATYKTNEVGKIIVIKKPTGIAGANIKSPNMADSVVIDFAPMENKPTEFTDAMLAQIARAGGPRRRGY
jgi:phage terminase large subunit